MVLFSCCMCAECFLSFFGKSWKSVSHNYIILSLAWRVVRLLLTTKNQFETMICFIISVFLAYTLDGWIAFLKLCLEMHNGGFRNQTALGFTTCTHTITYIMFFSTYIPVFRHLCILLNEYKCRNAILFCFYCVFPVLPFIFMILISNTYVGLKYLGIESVPCHLRAKMFQNWFLLQNVMLVCIVKWNAGL